MVDVDVSGGTPGLALHGNPMYGGRTMAHLHDHPRRGHGRRRHNALDEYERMLATSRPAPAVRAALEDPDYQRYFGAASRRSPWPRPRSCTPASSTWSSAAARRGGRPVLARGHAQAGFIAREGMRVAWDAMQADLFRRARARARRRAHGAHLPRPLDGQQPLREHPGRLGGAADRPARASVPSRADAADLAGAGEVEAGHRRRGPERREQIGGSAERSLGECELERLPRQRARSRVRACRLPP